MAKPTLSSRARSADNKIQAWRSAIGGRVTAIVSQPEPRAIGTVSRARQLQSGNFLFGSELVEAPGTTIWDIEQPSEAFTNALHGFEWLDDLGAAGDAPARVMAHHWVWEWIERYGAARGPGWYPDLAGRRLIRWISHAPFLLKGQESAQSHKFFKSLGRQTNYLAHAWSDAAPGLPRIEALTGLLYAALSLEGAEGFLKSARRGLAKCCDALGEDGAVASRNPEELLKLFTLLVWADHAQRGAGQPSDAAQQRAIARIAPTLRGLRMGDGTLARFHGGGRGEDGLLDQSLADCGIRAKTQAKTVMGYARLSAGRSVVIMDVAPPAEDAAGLRAHAGTLAFEMSAGRRPIIVNQGPGDTFGPDWRRHARETSAHSTVEVGGASMASFTPMHLFGQQDREALTGGPKQVALERAVDASGHWALGSHDGYTASHGLFHERRLFMTPDGTELRGEDTLSAQSSRGQAKFARMREAGTVTWRARFHLHPEVDASLDLGGDAISLILRSGEVWIFRQSGGKLSLEPSTYLDQRRLNPRLTQQIVVTVAAMDYASRIKWVLGRAGDRGVNVRDFETDQ